MGYQKLKEQAERENSIIIDIDNVIKITCQKIKEEKIPLGQESEAIIALASLVTARAMLG